MKKILALIGSLTLITTSSATLISCGEPKVVSDEDKISLGSLSLTTNLGVINEVDLTTEDQKDNWVYNAIVAKNNDFIKISNEVNILFDDGDFSNPPLIKFKIQAKKTSNKYKGEVEFQVNYNFDNEHKRWLQDSNVIKEKNLTVPIYKNSSPTTESDIKIAFRTANGVGGTWLSFEMLELIKNENGRELSSKWKVTGNSKGGYYVGTIIVNVTHQYMSTGPDDK